MDFNDLLGSLLSGKDAKPEGESAAQDEPEAQGSLVENLLDQILGDKGEAGLLELLAPLLGGLAPAKSTEVALDNEAEGAAEGATRLDLAKLLDQPDLEDKLTELLQEKFKLPKVMAALLAEAVLKRVSKKPRKKTTRKKKTTSSSSAKKPRKKTTSSSAKKKTTSSTAKKKATSSTAKKKTTSTTARKKKTTSSTARKRKSSNREEEVDIS
jgi:hypothetical protein